MNKTSMAFKTRSKRFLAAFLTLVTLLLIPFSVAYAAPVGTLIKSFSEAQEVSAGVVHESVRQFTSEGWLSINILKVDLTNPYVKLKAMTNTTNSTKLTNVKNIAAANSAVAAVNANFYFSTGNGNGNALGPVMSDGKIISMSHKFNSNGSGTSMATFALDSLKIPSIDYWKTEIYLLSPMTGRSNEVTNYNRMSSYDFRDVIVLDRSYGKMSLGTSEKYPQLVEMVVSEGKVKEIRIGKPPVEIPENGFVAVSYSTNNNFILDNFNIDFPAVLDVKCNIDWKKIDMAVSGSSVLLKDGNIPSEFSFASSDNNKRNPRTMVGTTKDGKTLYIVTVDGRQNASVGMTLKEAAQYMKELGAYNALNLDGGGSTTMVSRPLAENSLAVVNTPSDSSLRGVTTALGIVSTAPAGKLAGLVIESEHGNVFINSTRRLTVKGYDEYYNPVDIKLDDVKWKVSGVKGTVTRPEGENYFVFKPSEIGYATLTATVGNVKQSIGLYSLSAPVRLVLDKKSIQVPVGTTASLSVTGYNVNGYLAPLHPEDVKFSVVSNKASDGSDVEIGTVSPQGVFTPKQSGTGYIGVSVGNTHAYCAVSVRFSSSLIKDDFEKEIGRTFTSYPAGTEGAYSMSKDAAYKGKTSGKLSYNFVDSASSRAVYMTYGSQAISIAPDHSFVGVYAYIPKTIDSAANADNQIKVEVADTDGKLHLLTLSSKMNWTGWKYLQASLSDIKNPAYITRLYVVRTTAGASQGEIYFDNLLTGKTWYEPVDTSSIPADTNPTDPLNVNLGPYKAASDSFRFSFMGQSSEPSNDAQKLLIDKMTTKINKWLDTSAVAGNTAHEFVKDLSKPYVSAYKGFNSYTVKNSLFIQLDMSKGGLRASNSAQWSEFLKLLETNTSDNIFIFMAKSPDEMTDSLEAKLFKDTLTDYKLDSGKNVMVFYEGSEDKVILERGVRYFSSRGYNIKDLDMKTIDSAMYFLVTVKGKQVTYQLKPMTS